MKKIKNNTIKYNRMRLKKLSKKYKNNRDCFYRDEIKKAKMEWGF